MIALILTYLGVLNQWAELIYGKIEFLYDFCIGVMEMYCLIHMDITIYSRVTDTVNEDFIHFTTPASQIHKYWIEQYQIWKS